MMVQRAFVWTGVSGLLMFGIAGGTGVAQAVPHPSPPARGEVNTCAALAGPDGMTGNQISLRRLGRLAASGQVKKARRVFEPVAVFRWIAQETDVPTATVVRWCTRYGAKRPGVLFANGTRKSPNAGVLIGNGFSYTDSTCSSSTSCDGGRGGRLFGSGGAGRNGGDGGNAGLLGGKAGNGGDANPECSGATCDGGDGGRAGWSGWSGRQGWFGRCRWHGRCSGRRWSRGAAGTQRCARCRRVPRDGGQDRAER